MCTVYLYHVWKRLRELFGEKWTDELLFITFGVHIQQNLDARRLWIFNKVMQRYDYEDIAYVEQIASNLI